MKKDSSIFISGANGLIGTALVQLLRDQGFKNLLIPSSKDLDLRDQDKVNKYFKNFSPEYVFHLAAIVGGIYANNTYPADFIYDNTIMHSNIFYAAHKINVKKILFPGSACSYPKFAKQPVIESEFLNGVIEPTNLAYAAAKINGMVMGQAFAKQYKMNIIIPVLTNAYGINDCFDLNNSHVIPALMQKLHNAKVNKEKKVELWGTGYPLREFINSIDAANALLFLMKNYNNTEIINVGTGIEITILELANKIKSVVGYTGAINFDTSKPDGSPRKCLDSTKLQKLGWKSVVDFDQGLKEMYKFHFRY